jgi:hypothetical protein
MGALIPSHDDLDIINKLNDVFTAARLAKLRQHIHDTNDDVFANTRHLHRIAFRLRTYPSSARGRGRWFLFLRDLLSAQNKLDILTGIRNAVNDWDSTTRVGCVGIRFWARFKQGLSSDYDVEVLTDPRDANGQYWVTITMLCDHEIDPGDPGDPSGPGPDTGEQGPVHPALRAAPRRGSKKSAKKRKSKATVKKAARKASKKKTAKRRR